eukprot:TRINITY_DN24713_c0_g1_i1.p1 TRINITY_DN24713_c0_g1~~TRINITY_DN24713_c0_g1_i1.p1  ORF type:complete len:513 (+),score=134.64 TRINITY_DN24713_c0_g1_i1:36-1574(+)
MTGGSGQPSPGWDSTRDALRRVSEAEQRIKSLADRVYSPTRRSAAPRVDALPTTGPRRRSETSALRNNSDPAALASALPGPRSPTGSQRSHDSQRANSQPSSPATQEPCDERLIVPTVPSFDASPPAALRRRKEGSLEATVNQGPSTSPLHLPTGWYDAAARGVVSHYIFAEKEKEKAPDTARKPSCEAEWARETTIPQPRCRAGTNPALVIPPTLVDNSEWERSTKELLPQIDGSPTSSLRAAAARTAAKRPHGLHPIVVQGDKAPGEHEHMSPPAMKIVVEDLGSGREKMSPVEETSLLKERVRRLEQTVAVLQREVEALRKHARAGATSAPAMDASVASPSLPMNVATPSTDPNKSPYNTLNPLSFTTHEPELHLECLHTIPLVRSRGSFSSVAISPRLKREVGGTPTETLTNTLRVTQVQCIFCAFDSEQKGHLSFRDCKIMQSLTEHSDLKQEDWAELCAYLGADASVGLLVSDLLRMYNESETGGADLERDVRIAQQYNDEHCARM